VAFSSEPVVVAATPSGALAVVITALDAFGVWTPTTQQYNALLGLVALLVVVGASYARSRVTPTPK
jgi:hypothetical protein